MRSFQLHMFTTFGYGRPVYTKDIQILGYN
jgi:hypothetical protein